MFPVVSIPAGTSLYAGMNKKGLYCPFQNNFRPTGNLLFFGTVDVASKYVRDKSRREGCIWEYHTLKPMYLLNLESVEVLHSFASYLNQQFEQATTEKEKIDFMLMKYAMGFERAEAKQYLLDVSRYAIRYEASREHALQTLFERLGPLPNYIERDGDFLKYVGPDPVKVRFGPYTTTDHEASFAKHFPIYPLLKQQTSQMVLPLPPSRLDIQKVEKVLLQADDACGANRRYSYQFIDNLVLQHLSTFIRLYFPQCIGYANGVQLDFHEEIAIFRTNRLYLEYLVPIRMLSIPFSSEPVAYTATQSQQEAWRALYVNPDGQCDPHSLTLLFADSTGQPSSIQAFSRMGNQPYSSFSLSPRIVVLPAFRFVRGKIGYELAGVSKKNSFRTSQPVAVLAFDSNVIQTLWCRYLAAQSVKNESIPGTRLTIYSWNVCWGCMTNNRDGIDWTAGLLAKSCQRDACLDNVVQTVASWVQDEPDVLFFQEASRWESWYAVCQDRYEATATKQEKAELVTFTHRRYNRLFSLDGDLVDRNGRPFLIVALQDRRRPTREPFLVVNVHFPHDVLDQESVEKSWSDMMVRVLYHSHFTSLVPGWDRDKAMSLMKQAPLVVGGDWNGDFTKGFLWDQQTVSLQGTNAPKTCCTGDKYIRTAQFDTDTLVGDYIMVSDAYRFERENTVPETFDRSILTSDHVPVTCTVSLTKSVPTNAYDDIQTLKDGPERWTPTWQTWVRRFYEWARTQYGSLLGPNIPDQIDGIVVHEAFLFLDDVRIQSDTKRSKRGNARRSRGRQSKGRRSKGRK